MSATVCPLCRESLHDADLVACPGCQAVFHQACRLELSPRGCATLGCSGLASLDPVGRPESRIVARVAARELVSYPVIRRLWLRASTFHVLVLLAAVPYVLGIVVATVMFAARGDWKKLATTLPHWGVIAAVLSAYAILHHLAGRPPRWRADYRWGRRLRAPERMVRRGLGLALACLLLLPLAALLAQEFGPRERRAFAAWGWAVALVPALLAGAPVFFRLARAWKYRGGQVSYEALPLRRSAPITLTFQLPRILGAFGELRLVLRCVREEDVTRGAGRNAHRERVAWELAREEWVIEEAELGERREVSLRLQLSSELPASNLSGESTTYHELQADALAPGLDYHARFLLPVY